MTRDHTYVQRLVDEGRLDEDDVAVHPWRNVVLRAASTGPTRAATSSRSTCEPGDRMLLASDGLTDLVDERVIARDPGRPRRRRRGGALVAARSGAGGRDNITCVLATVVEGPEISADGVLLGAVRDPRNVVDIAAVRIRLA